MTNMNLKIKVLPASTDLIKICAKPIFDNRLSATSQILLIKLLLEEDSKYKMVDLLTSKDNAQDLETLISCDYIERYSNADGVYYIINQDPYVGTYKTK